MSNCEHPCAISKDKNCARCLHPLPHHPSTWRAAPRRRFKIAGCHVTLVQHLGNGFITIIIIITTIIIIITIIISTSRIDVNHQSWATGQSFHGKTGVSSSPEIGFGIAGVGIDGQTASLDGLKRVPFALMAGLHQLWTLHLTKGIEPCVCVYIYLLLLLLLLLLL